MITCYAIYATDLHKLQTSSSKSAQLLLDCVPQYTNYYWYTKNNRILMSGKFHSSETNLRHHMNLCGLNIDCHIILSHHQHIYLLKAITEDPQLNIEIWEQKLIITPSQRNINRDCECTLL